MHVLAHTETGGIAGAIGGIVAAMFSAWLIAKVSRTGAQTEGNASVLRYHKSYLIIGWGCFALFLTAAVASQFGSDLGNAKVLYLGIFGGFALLGLLLVVIYHRSSIRWQGDVVTYAGLWGKPFEFHWAEVERAKFSGMSQWWIVSLKNGRKVRVSTYMGGAIDFMRLIKERAAIDVPCGCLPNGQRIEI